jgi:hypothetical protein
MWIKNIEIKRLFDELPDNEKPKVDILERIIKNNIGINLNRRTLPVPDEYLQYYGNLKSKQYPNELAQFLAFLHARKDQINTYLEIGVENCGTFYTVDSYLRSINPHFRKSIAIDKMREPSNFEAYKKRYHCEYLCMNSRELKIKNAIDLVFIDGDHSYNAVKADFEKVKDNCKFVAFHDVVCNNIRGVEVKHLWDNIKISYEYYEFLNSNPTILGRLGIGVLICT